MTINGTKISPERPLLPLVPIVCFESTLVFGPFISDQYLLDPKCTQYPDIILISMNGSQNQIGWYPPALSISKKSFFQERASKTFLN